MGRTRETHHIIALQVVIIITHDSIFDSLGSETQILIIGGAENQEVEKWVCVNPDVWEQPRDIWPKLFSFWEEEENERLQQVGP